MASLTWRKVALLGALALALYGLATLEIAPGAAAGPLAQATATPTPGPAFAQVGGVNILAPHASAGGNLLGVDCQTCSGGASGGYAVGTVVPIQPSGAVAAQTPMAVQQVATPIVQVVGTLPPLAAGEAIIGRVGGNTLHPSQNPTLSVASSYVSGDYVGTSSTPWTWTACRTSGGTGQIQSVTVVDKASQSVAGEVWLFDRTVTVPLDSAAWTITDADAQFLIGVVPTGPYYASAANSVSVATGVGLTYWCNAGTSIFGAFVIRAAGTWASGDLSIGLGLSAD